MAQRRLQEYRTEDLAVTFDPGLCIHSGRCLAGAPAVFDVKRRRWIELESGTPDEIAAVIERCPSGALQYERLDGGPQEAPPEGTTVVPLPNGPLSVRGRLEVRDASGNVVKTGTRFTFCRCGGSENKPFCDNSHRRNGFRG
jgi:uncharacterized Fe-S cluster protein YjdI